jgi:chemotaxis protein histidine kinase CheA
MEISMLKDGKQPIHPQPTFFIEAQTLLARSEDCLSHLHLIHNDEEAIQCLLGSLSNLAQTAADHGVAPLCEFSRHVHKLLHQAQRSIDLNERLLEVIKGCLTLMAWQLELIDPHDGQLHMDDSEQALLIAALAEHVGEHGALPMPHASH